MIAGVAIVLAAAIAGLLASGMGADGADDGTSRAAGVELVAPPGWEPVEGAAAPAGLRLEQPLAARAARGDGLLVAGRVPDTVFADRLGSEAGIAAGAPDAVRLGRLEAYRWRGERMTVLAAPTSKGTAVVACSGAAGARRACERQAATLDVLGAEATTLDTLAFFGVELDAALARLERRRAAGEALLRAARDRAAHAEAAVTLARAHRAAAGALAALAPPAAAEAASGEIETALGSIEARYEDLARAARRGKRRAHAAAARDVERQEAALRRLVARL